jgi:hypothetical protein
VSFYNNKNLLVYLNIFHFIFGRCQFDTCHKFDRRDPPGMFLKIGQTLGVIKLLRHNVLMCSQCKIAAAAHL